LSVVLLCQIIFLLELNEKKLKKEFIIFHKSYSSVIGYRNGEQLFLQKDLNNSQLKKQSFMRTYQTSENISDVHLVDFKNYIQFANKDILLIDHLGIYKNIGVKNPIIVLQHSPKINLLRLINTVHPSKIIADGSNYKREVLRWENSCLKNNIPFYNTAKKGAFILRE